GARARPAEPARRAHAPDDPQRAGARGYGVSKPVGAGRVRDDATAAAAPGQSLTPREWVKRRVETPYRSTASMRPASPGAVATRPARSWAPSEPPNVRPARAGVRSVSRRASTPIGWRVAAASVARSPNA